jgi:hypothetical protein
MDEVIDEEIRKEKKKKSTGNNVETSMRFCFECNVNFIHSISLSRDGIAN